MSVLTLVQDNLTKKFMRRNHFLWVNIALFYFCMVTVLPFFIDPYETRRHMRPRAARQGVWDFNGLLTNVLNWRCVPMRGWLNCILKPSIAHLPLTRFFWFKILSSRPCYLVSKISCWDMVCQSEGVFNVPAKNGIDVSYYFKTSLSRNGSYIWHPVFDDLKLWFLIRNSSIE